MLVNDNDKLNILMQIMLSHRKAIDYRRDLQFKAFSWASALYTAIMAGLITLISKGDKIHEPIPLLISFGSLLIAVTYIYFLFKCMGSIRRNAKNIVPIEIEIRMFEEGFYLPNKSLYSTRSKDWGTEINPSPETWFYIVSVLILSILIIILAWLPVGG